MIFVPRGTIRLDPSVWVIGRSKNRIHIIFSQGIQGPQVELDRDVNFGLRQGINGDVGRCFLRMQITCGKDQEK